MNFYCVLQTNENINFSKANSEFIMNFLLLEPCNETDDSSNEKFIALEKLIFS